MHILRTPGIFKGDEDIPAFEPSTLLEQLANGIALQELAKRVDHGDAQSNRWAEAAGFRGGGGGGGGGDDAVGSPMTIHKNTLNRRMSSYHKRANLTQFLHWANLLGVPGERGVLPRRSAVRPAPSTHLPIYPPTDPSTT